LEQTIATMHRVLGEADGDTLAAIGNLAVILWQFSERAEAYWLQAQVVDTWRRAAGDADPATQAAIAVLNAMQQDGMP
jgi:hypothetical protein